MAREIVWVEDHAFTTCGTYRADPLGNDYYLLQDSAGRSRRLYTRYAVQSVIDLGALPSLSEQPDHEPIELG
jgi:hypothetical protein